MAIANMKRLTLLGMNADKSRILRKIQRLGCVEISRSQEASQEAELARLADMREKLNRVDWAVKKLTPMDPAKGGLFAQRPVADAEALAAAQVGENETMAQVARLEQLERRMGESKSRENRIRAAMKRLNSWKELDVAFSQMQGGGNVRFLLLSGSPQRMADFREKSAGIEPQPEIQEMSPVEGRSCAAVVTHAAALEETDALARACGLDRASVEGFSGTPQQEADALKAQLAAIEEERLEIGKEMEEMARDLQAMRVFRDLLSMAKDRQEAAARLIATRSAFLLEGWTPADKCDVVKQTVEKCARDVCLEFRDPLDTEKPPTLLVNKKAIQPFEAVIEMFAMPDPRSFDPTAIMAPFFALLFGIMVSDAGYGLTLMILAALYIKLVKPRGGMAKMSRVIFWGGAATFFWGVMFGGWFGETWHPVMFAPLDDPVSMIILCIVVGMVHVLTGVGVAAYMNIRAGRIMDAVWDQGMWFLILLGVPMLLLDATAPVGKWMAVIGMAGIFLFGGRAKKGIISRLMSGAGKLYDITSFLGDILSYMRLFGMGLATGVIGMVFNLLAGMVMGSIPGMIAGILILVAGHGFNLGINALGAYVNACRLQYIEFFGHFYEQGGVPFRPLAYNTRYVDIDPAYDAD